MPSQPSIFREVVDPDPGSFFRSHVWGCPRLKPYPHRHPEWELCAVLQGCGRQRIGSTLRRFSAGELVLLGPDLPHDSWDEKPADGPHRRLVVLFDPDRLGRAFLDLPDAQGLQQLRERAARGLVVRPPHADALIATALPLPEERGLARLQRLLGFLAGVMRAPAEEILPVASATPGDGGASLAVAIRGWLAEHADEPISLADAARQAGMHPQAFARFFRRETGHSLVGYLGHLRTDRACRLLLEGDLAVVDIAARVGFGSLAQFNRVFRRIHRMTPSAYRRLRG